MSDKKIVHVKVMYEQGVREGIRFAIEHFLIHLKEELFDEMFEKTSLYIIEKWHMKNNIKEDHELLYEKLLNVVSDYMTLNPDAATPEGELLSNLAHSCKAYEDCYYPAEIKQEK